VVEHSVQQRGFKNTVMNVRKLQREGKLWHAEHH
jgi:hypothetical protein